MFPKRFIYLFCKRCCLTAALLLIIFISGLILLQYTAITRILPRTPSHANSDTNINLTAHRMTGELALSLPHPVRESPNSQVHIFYYPWYGTPEFDGTWLHWNHRYLPNWDHNDKKSYPTGSHIPPEDIGANYFPSLGCYSSQDPTVLETHMKWLREADVGVAVVSWYPPHLADREGKSLDLVLPAILNAAEKFGIKIALHMEPYENRSPQSLRKDLEYITATYNSHPALHKMYHRNKLLPVYYVYDSYTVSAKSWRDLLVWNKTLSVRGTAYDGVFLGLLVELRHRDDIKHGGFDGFYTYFAANDFTYGSTWKNWKTLASFATKNRLMFVPSVGPGYVDTEVRPWNTKTTRTRRNGQYYRTSWSAALATLPKVISITSFNEWHEGTQIEPAILKNAPNRTYLSYAPKSPEFYLELTRTYSEEFRVQSQSFVRKLK